MNRRPAAAESGRWLAWISRDDDPARHAAMEEACLRETRDRFLLFWINRPSVHVGKNQNLWSQVSAAEVHRDRVPPYRRLSGGGTVYHDGGNLNFSIIADGAPRIDFRTHLGTLLPFFAARGVDAMIRNRSDLFHDGRKFSGNSEYFSGGRVLHHGTLLFDADLGAMDRYLTRDTSAYRDRSIDSKRSPTMNLKPLLPDIPDTGGLARALLRFLAARHRGLRVLGEPPRRLVEAAEGFLPRFRDPEWVFGGSPAYEMERLATHRDQRIGCHLRVSGGRIRHAEVRVEGESASDPAFPRSLLDRLDGCLHAPGFVLERLTDPGAGAESPPVPPEVLLKLFF
ncbi:MAG: biotin/lipoate A/B protein ligase family protein [Puniceicoccaceae bacterium]